MWDILTGAEASDGDVDRPVVSWVEYWRYWW